MTTLDAKREERAHVIEAISLLGVQVIGELRDHERPDFRFVLADGRRVGLEHTRAVNESLADGSGVKDRFSNRIQQSLEKAGVTGHVNISLSEGAAATLARSPARFRSEASSIVELAKQALTQPLGNEPWRVYKRFEFDIVADDGVVVWRDPDRDRGAGDLDVYGVRFSSMVMVRPYDRVLVTCSKRAWPQGPGLVQDAIDEKADLLDIYRQSGDDEYWILVVGSDPNVNGSSLAIDHVLGEFVSPFDRTLFLEHWEGRCIDLKTTRP